MALGAGGEAHRRGADRQHVAVAFRQRRSRGAKPSGAARLRLFLGCLLLAVACQPREALAGIRPVLGANIDLAALSGAQRAAALDRLAAAGVTSVRMELDWNRVEPKPGEFVWGAFDAAVSDARARKIAVVLVLGPCASWAVNPSWQVPADQKPRSVPKSVELWRRYVKASVLHFRDRVHCWQVREQPNARNLRGTRSDYLSLLDSATRLIRSLDPKAIMIAPEAGFLDVGGIDRFAASPSGRAADVIGVYLPADPSRMTLPWAVLSQEVLGSPEASPRKPVWVLGAQEGASADACAIGYLLAWVFGADRCYLPADAVNAEWTRPLRDLAYEGYTSPAPGAWMLFFAGPSGPAAIAWSATATAIAPPAPALPTVEGAAAAGEDAAVALPASSPAPSVAIGPRFTVIPAAEWQTLMRPGAPTRSDVLAARGTADLANLPMVYLDCSMAEHPEFGLYNRALRSLGGGACLEEERQGRSCLRTCMTYRQEEMAQDSPWLYFDVDDSWLYFDRGNTKLVVTIECEGSYLGAEKLGLNLVYDSTTGYRFTRWQWVGPGYDWRSYRVVLDDVNFSNRDGWDFRINAKGSVQDLWVSAVTIEKVVEAEPLPAPEAAAPVPAG